MVENITNWFFCPYVALNEALKEEIQHLKVLTGQAIPNGGPMMNFPPSFGGNQQFYPGNHAMHTLMAAQQFQQLQIHPQKQQQPQPHHHQFQQQQLHQFQQQQLMHQEQQQQQEQYLRQTGEQRRGSVPFTGKKDNASDINNSASKD